MTRRQLVCFRVIFTLYLAALLWLCFGHFESTPDIPAIWLGIPADKVVHFLMFFPFPILAFFTFDRYTEKFWPSVLCTAAAFIVGAVLAAGTEIGQARLTTYRQGDPADFKADLLALGISSLIVLFIDLWKQRK